MSPLANIRDVIQEDVNQRGLRADPAANLITACADDFFAACRGLAEATNPTVGIVTGFYIAHADPPCGETDGPLGAVFLARALVPLGIKVVLLTDAFCTPALEMGIAQAGLRKAVPIVTLPTDAGFSPKAYWEMVAERAGPLTHLLALERVGPSHTPESVRNQPGATAADVENFSQAVSADHYDRCHSMRGRDITAYMSPAHLLFEPSARPPGLVTIGIGDGGNEIGMGKISWRIIRNNIPGGAVVACRTPCDHLIVCGISNWGAYGLAVGVQFLRGKLDPELFDSERERQILESMVRRGPLVDGVTGEQAATVDGLPFDRYIEPLRKIATPTVARGSAAGPGAEVRHRARSNEWTGDTAGLAPGFVQANLVVVPRQVAFDFLLFCQRNPKPCPLLDVTEPGDPEPKRVAAGADLRTDLPRYRVYQNGELIEEPTDLRSWWREDFVGFLIGCSYTFENALLHAGLPLRHLEMGRTVPMYRTNIMCHPAGKFHGPMVVSMRPMTPGQAIQATRICSRFPQVHGTPLHFGDPTAIGIGDIGKPDWGDPVEIRPGEVPVFWACGVTPQAVAMAARPPLLITHKPGHMFLTDWRDTDLEGDGVACAPRGSGTTAAP